MAQGKRLAARQEARQARIQKRMDAGITTKAEKRAGEAPMADATQKPRPQMMPAPRPTAQGNKMAQLSPNAARPQNLEAAQGAYGGSMGYPMPDSQIQNSGVAGPMQRPSEGWMPNPGAWEGVQETLPINRLPAGATPNMNNLMANNLMQTYSPEQLAAMQQRPGNFLNSINPGPQQQSMLGNQSFMPEYMQSFGSGFSPYAQMQRSASGGVRTREF